MQLVFSAPVSPAVCARASVRRSPARYAARQQVGRGKLAARAGKVELITAEELEVAIATRDKPLVIDFYARHGPIARLAARSSAFCLLGSGLRRSARAQLVRSVRADGRGA
jgi:hypothetical protein